MFLRSAGLCTLVLWASGNLAAQSASAAAAHHGHTGEAAYRDLAPPPLMEGIGDASLKITTSSPQAQAYFNQGLRLLHCFWDFEAWRAFKEASRLDPDAAMPYWGIFQALSFGRSMKGDRDAALEKAKSLMSKASDHEQFYIRAAEHELKDDEAERKAYHLELETLIDRYPDDANAQAFLALSMGGYDKDGKPVEGAVLGQAMLKNLIAAHPGDAAAHHYFIHLLESSPHPETALHSAEVLPSLAPASGHMVHMAGHIYWRIGDYEKARQSFLDSMRVDEDYLASGKIGPEQDWNYTHNIAYLIATCAEDGRYKEGLEYAKKLTSITSPPGLTPAFFVIWAGGSVSRIHIRFGDWQAVENDPVEFGTGADSAGPLARSYVEGLRLYARGMAALDQKDVDAAARQAEALDALLWRLDASKPKEKKKDAADGEDDPTLEVKLLSVLSLDLRGNIQSARGSREQAVRLLEEAVSKEKDLGYSEPPRYYRPELESLGYAYLTAREWEKAREAFTKVLAQRPRSGHALFGIAESYAQAGDASRAVAAYEDFLAAWAHADSDLPQMKQARAWLAAHQR